MGEEKQEDHAAAIKEINCGVNTEIEKETTAQKFCRRHGINPNLVMLKITLFVMYGGEFNSIVSPLLRKSFSF